MGKSMGEQISNWCRHYSGLMNDACDAGVNYDDVRGNETGLAAYPCFKDSNCAERCASALFLSEQEVAEEVTRINSHAARFLTEMAEGRFCPHCHAPITRRVQVGRCVYAEPCQHRLFQGRLPKEEAES